MRRGTMMAALFAFVAGVVLGCGPSAAPAVGDDPPKPITKGELAAEEAKLADLEKEITAKEKEIAVKQKELAELRAKADAIRSRIGGKGKASGVDELQKLIDKIPKDSQPGGDRKAEIERNKANQWLKDNVVGKVVKLTGPLVIYSVTPNSVVKDRYNFSFNIGKGLEGIHNIGRLNVGTCRAGDATWVVLLRLQPQDSDSFHVFELDEAAAKQFRALEGKSVTIGGKIISASFEPGSGQFGPNGVVLPTPPEFRVILTEVTVDGINPRKK